MLQENGKTLFIFRSTCWGRRMAKIVLGCMFYTSSTLRCANMTGRRAHTLASSYLLIERHRRSLSFIAHGNVVRRRVIVVYEDWRTQCRRHMDIVFERGILTTSHSPSVSIYVYAIQWHTRRGGVKKINPSLPLSAHLLGHGRSLWTRRRGVSFAATCRRHRRAAIRALNRRVPYFLCPEKHTASRRSPPGSRTRTGRPAERVQFRGRRSRGARGNFRIFYFAVALPAWISNAFYVLLTFGNARDCSAYCEI